MTGYLDAALRRMRLPISIIPSRRFNYWWIGAIKPEPNGDWIEIQQYANSPAEATAAYLALCAELAPAAS